MTTRKSLAAVSILIVVALLGLLLIKGGIFRSDSGTGNIRHAILDRGLPSLRDLVKDTKRIVVNISTTTVVKRRGGNDRSGDPREHVGQDRRDGFSEETPSQEFRQRSLGSGFIIDKDGYIITNNHVIEKASVIKVRLSDGKEYEAKVIGRDVKTDLALIKVGPNHVLPVASIGDSDKLEVGDWVVAIGNPYGLDYTVTAGIVSAKGRVIGQGPYDDFIQTDASINPGNSGGPLFNLRGQVVGINSAIVSGGQGIGFAIPVNMARAVLTQLRDRGKVVRGWLGVVIQKVTPELARNFGLSGPEGALVSDILKDSPAARADIRRGDVIVSFDEKPIKDMEQLPRIVTTTAAGKKVKVGLIREGRRIEVSLTVAEIKEEAKETRTSTTHPTAKYFGLVVEDITSSLAHQLGLKDKRGVLVTDIIEGSPADDAEIRPGDVVQEIDRKSVASVTEFKEVLRQAKPMIGVVMLVKREGIPFFTVVRQERGDQ